MYHEGHAAILNRLRIESLKVKKKAVNRNIKIKSFIKNFFTQYRLPLSATTPVSAMVKVNYSCVGNIVLHAEKLSATIRAVMNMTKN